MNSQVVALAGGLGNQLFQYAFAHHLGENGNRVRLDLSCVRWGSPDIFEIPDIGESAKQMAIPITRLMPAPGGRLPRMAKALRRMAGPESIEVDDSAQGPSSIAPLPVAWWFGYWQRLSYARAIIPTLREAFRVNEGKGGREGHGVVGMHVRRGDYAGNRMEVPSDWYRRALEIVDIAGEQTPQVHVFTDDPTWCTRNLDVGRQWQIRSTGRAVEDLRILASCDYLIVSRSTFSWWAASISKATVVFPTPWFPGSTDCHDLIPSSWLSCSVEQGMSNQ